VESWSPDVRDAVETAVAQATAEQRRLAAEDDEICAQALIKEGVTLVELRPQERVAMASASRAEVEKTRQRFGEDLIALFENDLAQLRP
jgi:TRAP-type transport system periplasmic protein